MKSVILYFGSFNPIHNGHVAIAEYMIAQKLCDELWFVVSPQNPMKPYSSLAPEQNRLDMVRLAINASRFRAKMIACDVEFGMPKPSYTINTLGFLSQKYPDAEFSILAGGDIAPQIDRWKQGDRIVKQYRIYLYPRDGYAPDERFVVLGNAPHWGYSSTTVRNRLMAGESIADLVPPAVANYITARKLWCGEIERLNCQIDTHPLDYKLYLKRGKAFYKRNDFGLALNDFKQVIKLNPAKVEANGYIAIIENILEFHHKDTYNP